MVKIVKEIDDVLAAFSARPVNRDVVLGGILFFRIYGWLVSNWLL